jgi:diaminopimelate epimerase
MTAKKINDWSFYKMSALGNDFIIFDLRKDYFKISPRQIQIIADRKNIGCDQLIIIKSLDSGHNHLPLFQFKDELTYEIEIYNRDGSKSGACGNATRCVAGLIFEENPSINNIKIKTLAGLLDCNKISNNEISINMGKIRFFENFFYANHNFYCANIGNPHAISFIDEAIGNEEFFRIGPQVENHPNFPEKTNVEFAQILSDNLIAVRVWERGAGETTACGSGACAVVACAIKNNLVKSQKVTVKFIGGILKINYSDEQIIMTGGYKKIFKGVIDEQLFL